MLLEIAQQFAATLELSQLVPLVLDRVVSLLRAERALFVLLDAQGRIERAVTHNLPWTGPPAPLPVARSILEKVVRERTMVLANSLADPAGSTESMRRFGLRRVAAVPVLRRGALVGVLYADGTARGRDDMHAQGETLRAVASLVGVAVENARLFDELRYRRDLLAWMVHDLRSPITAVSLNASLMLETAEGERREMLAEIESAAERTTKMIDWTLALDRIEDARGGGVPRALDVLELAARSAAEHGALARERGVSVSIEAEPDLPRALSFADRLGVVLDNLLFNAFKFADRGSRVVVRARRRGDVGPRPDASVAPRRGTSAFERARQVTAEEATGYVEVSVRNVGEPVSAEVRRRLFSRGAQGRRADRSTPSTGLGLAIAYDCVQSLGGSLWLESPDGAAETVFAFTVPVEGGASPDPGVA